MGNDDRYAYLFQPCSPSTIWVCGACGRTSKTKSGVDAQSQRVADTHWDESCMMNAVLCYVDKDANGDWVAVPGASE